jgi:putative ABC transport system substrate-binding protein
LDEQSQYPNRLSPGRRRRSTVTWSRGRACRIGTRVLIGVSTPSVVALRHETAKVPIVFVQVVDPVALGFVTSLARLGGNTTGFLNFEFSMGGKWLGMLKDFAPGISKVKVLFGPETAPYAEQFLHSIEAAAPSFAVTVTAAPFRDAVMLEQVINALAGQSDAGLIVLPDVSTGVHRDLIIALASRHRLPAVYPFRYFPVSAGLMSYGSNSTDLMRQGASYVDRILRGEKPADLPVQVPTKFELVINLKTAKALGLTVPPTLLATADEIIE